MMMMTALPFSPPFSKLEAYLGISTPGRHLISRSPNGWVPRTYCNGVPFPRFSQSCHTRRLSGMGEPSREDKDETCSRIHRSSLRVDGKSLQAGRRTAAHCETLRAFQNSDGRIRGILTSTKTLVHGRPFSGSAIWSASQMDRCLLSVVNGD